MVSPRAEVGVDNSSHTDICLPVGTLESPSLEIEERSQEYYHHDVIRMRILCR